MAVGRVLFSWVSFAVKSVMIYVDADACPVKAEIYRVARRYQVEVLVVANDGMLVPDDPLIRLVERPRGFDSVDDWIAGEVGTGDIVVTADIPLAGRCLERGARVLGPRGRAFNEDSIGEALAGRALQEMLRQSGQIGGGPGVFLGRVIGRGFFPSWMS